VARRSEAILASGRHSHTTSFQIFALTAGEISFIGVEGNCTAGEISGEYVRGGKSRGNDLHSCLVDAYKTQTKCCRR